MIDDKLIEEIAKQAKPKYQQDYSNFKPGEDYVMYSGQHRRNNNCFGL